MTAPSKGFISVITGLVLTAAAALPVSVAQFLMVPGIVVAMGLGAGTFHEPGKAGPVVTLAAIYLGSVAVWSGVAYGALTLLGKRRAA